MLGDKARGGNRFIEINKRWRKDSGQTSKHVWKLPSQSIFPPLNTQVISAIAAW